MRPPGIPIRVHPLLWVVLAALLAIAAARGGTAGLVYIALLAATALFSLCCHEWAHAYTARKLGVPPGPIQLGPFFNAAYLEREPDRPEQELWIASAGPLANLTLWSISLVLARLPLGGFSQAAGETSWIHAVMGLGNLLPAFPLDGGRMLRALLCRSLPWLVASRATLRVSALLALALPLAALLTDTVRSRPLLLGALALLSVGMLRAGRRQARLALLREVELQILSGEAEISRDVKEALDGRGMLPERSGYRPLRPAQFRLWKNDCEEACRRILGLSEIGSEGKERSLESGPDRDAAAWLDSRPPRDSRSSSP